MSVLCSACRTRNQHGGSPECGKRLYTQVFCTGGSKISSAFPVFVRHFVIVFDGYAAKGLTLRCQTISKHAIVRTIGDSQQAHSEPLIISERFAGARGRFCWRICRLRLRSRPGLYAPANRPADRSVDNSSQKTRPRFALRHVKMVEKEMIRCTRRAGEELYLHLHRSSDCVFQLRQRGCAASTSFCGLSLVVFEECK